jgi:hypothetical protein
LEIQITIKRTEWGWMNSLWGSKIIVDPSSQGMDEFIVDAIGTRSGSRRERPLKDLYSLVNQQGEPCQWRRKVMARGVTNQKEKVMLIGLRSAVPTEKPGTNNRSKDRHDKVHVSDSFSAQLEIDGRMSSPIRLLNDVWPLVDVVIFCSTSAKEPGMHVLLVVQLAHLSPQDCGGSWSKLWRKLQESLGGCDSSVLSTGKDMDGRVGEGVDCTSSTAAQSLYAKDKYNAGLEGNNNHGFLSGNEEGGERIIVPI